MWAPSGGGDGSSSRRDNPVQNLTEAQQQITLEYVFGFCQILFGSLSEKRCQKSILFWLRSCEESSERKSADTFWE